MQWRLSEITLRYLGINHTARIHLTKSQKKKKKKSVRLTRNNVKVDSCGAISNRLQLS